MEHKPQRRETILKYLAIQARFEELHNKQRLRYDDVIERLKSDFFIAHEGTLMRILRTEVEEPPPPDPNQLAMFEE